MWISTKSQSQEIDRRAIYDFGIRQEDLMEEAGLAVFNAVCEWLPVGKSIAVACGKGNNGADGFVVARLAQQQGYAVSCVVAATEFELNEASQLQLKRLRKAGVQPVFCDAPHFFENLATHLDRDLIVDALLGTGAEGLLREPLVTVIQAINESNAEVVSVDIPSGLSCDSGEPLGTCINSSETVTFGLAKPFIFQGQGPEMTGVWSVAHIGLPNELLGPTQAEVSYDVNVLRPKRGFASHKGKNGSLIIVAGSHDMRGAAVLAARAALRSGIGLVTVASVDPVLGAVSVHCPEATLLTLSDDPVDSAARILAVQNRFDAAVFGPGLSTSAFALGLLSEIWPRWTKPAVVDADALNLVASGVQLPSAKCVLTPHPGEMARLFPEGSFTRFEYARRASEHFGQTVVLKGAYSIIATPEEPLCVNTTGNSGMATAGMGDVLSGLIGTLLAQNLSPFDAAKLGVFWHGRAGDRCREKIAAIGFTAMEVADTLPLASLSQDLEPSA